VLKKMILVAAAAGVAMAGGIGIASAHESGHHDNNAACHQSNDTTQKHKGDAVASNTGVQDITGNVLGIQATKPSGAACPGVANGNGL
jgi:hypothetical protein